MVAYFKKTGALILAAALVLSLNLQVSAAETDAKSCIRQILNYYLHYQEAAQTDIDVLLSQLAEIDPQQALVWEQIIDTWTHTNREMEINVDVLPDGLPEDDSLCIVVMGYSLNSNGSMKPELEERLKVAFRSAQKYPDAYILCTGGATSGYGNITEAAVMAKWLRDRGIEKDRIISENYAMSTTQNAIYSCRLLKRDYPQVKKLAVITSDYHIYHSCMMFSGVSLLTDCEMEVVSNAVWDTGDESGIDVYQQAWGLSVAAGVELGNMAEPVLSQLQSITAEYDGNFSVTAHYSTGLVRDVTEESVIIWYDADTVGRQEVAVTYIENGIPATYEFYIDRDIPAPRTLSAEESEPEIPEAEPPYAPVREVLTIGAVWLLAVLLLKWKGWLK